MVLFLIFCPIIAAILIMAGAPARKTALAASVLNLVVTLLLFARFDRTAAGFQHVRSFAISPEWRLNFTTRIGGLRLVRVFLSANRPPAPGWVAHYIRQ